MAFSARHMPTGALGWPWHYGELRRGSRARRRLLALLIHTMVDIDEAMAHFQDALTFCRSAGYRPELGWTCYFYVGTLLPRNGEVVRARATSLLDESLGTSRVLAMRPLTERDLSRRGPGTIPVRFSNVDAYHYLRTSNSSIIIHAQRRTVGAPAIATGDIGPVVASTIGPRSPTLEVVAVPIIKREDASTREGSSPGLEVQDLVDAAHGSVSLKVGVVTVSPNSRIPRHMDKTPGQIYRLYHCVSAERAR